MCVSCIRGRTSGSRIARQHEHGHKTRLLLLTLLDMYSAAGYELMLSCNVRAPPPSALAFVPTRHAQLSGDMGAGSQHARTWLVRRAPPLGHVSSISS